MGLQDARGQPGRNDGPGMMGPGMMRMILIVMDADGNGAINDRELHAADADVARGQQKTTFFLEYDAAGDGKHAAVRAGTPFLQVMGGRIGQ